MEDTLGEKELEILDLYLSLNPCFNGRYSRSEVKRQIEKQYKVLILVLMEDTLGGEPDSDY